jgi:hypothetical protein
MRYLARYLIMRLMHWRLREIALVAEYAAIVVYFGYLWYTATPEETVMRATYIGNLIFAQFLAQLITVFIGVQIADQTARLRNLAIIATYGSFGVWLVLDFTQSLIVAMIWIVSIALALLNNHENTLSSAIVRGIWLMSAGFLVALVGSMMGIAEDALLSINLGTVAGWGLLYYGGLVTVHIAERTLPPPADDPEPTQS